VYVIRTAVETSENGGTSLLNSAARVESSQFDPQQMSLGSGLEGTDQFQFTIEFESINSKGFYHMEKGARWVSQGVGIAERRMVFQPGVND
jgi:hypothetical protein